MYKFIGIGLLAFLALLIIPVSSATQSDDPSMYGTATVALKDESGNILFENQIHNVVVDQGTAFMLNQTFFGGTWSGTTFPKVNALCVSDAGSFSTAESETPATFNSANSITGFTNCNRGFTWNVSPTSINTGVQSFVANTAFADGTTITGIGLCSVASGATPVLDCSTSGTSVVLFSVIDITDIPVPGGQQLDVTYTFNLD